MFIKNFIRSLTIITTLVLVGCGGGGGGGSNDVPSDRLLVFSLFPPGYFEGNYSDSTSLKGSFSNGDNVTGTLRVQSGSTTIFNSQPVITFDLQLSLTNTTTGATAAVSSEGYFSNDINNLTIVGGLNITDGVVTMATSTSIFPLTGSIGDFGNIGSYTLSDGTTNTRSWALDDGFNGNAKLVIATVSKDSSNVLEFTEVNTSTISQDGTILRTDITVTYHQFGNLTLTLSSL